jgi:hypothetical protein
MKTHNEHTGANRPPRAVNIPSLQERQEFWSWGYANEAFENVLEACGFISNPPQPLSKAVWRILYTGIITTYARPFTKSFGGHRLPLEIVPEEHVKLHEAIMQTRHKEIAHVDATTYQADDPQIGNINQIRITMTKDHNSLAVVHMTCPIPEIKQLTRQLLKKAEYHVGKFRRKYIDNSMLPPGDYKLNLDQMGLPLFIGVKRL